MRYEFSMSLWMPSQSYVRGSPQLLDECMIGVRTDANSFKFTVITSRRETSQNDLTFDKVIEFQTKSIGNLRL